jgi:hypothetical protein
MKNNMKQVRGECRLQRRSVKTTFIESDNYYHFHEEDYNNYKDMDDYDDIIDDELE